VNIDTLFAMAVDNAMRAAHAAHPTAQEIHTSLEAGGSVSINVKHADGYVMFAEIYVVEDTVAVELAKLEG
jgi:hypothetical protein